MTCCDYNAPYVRSLLRGSFRKPLRERPISFPHAPIGASFGGNVSQLGDRSRHLELRTAVEGHPGVSGISLGARGKSPAAFLQGAAERNYRI